MFIVCPSCSGPYRIPADQIAPLVQTACPHCEYRIILDFEAANEPSLREAGHQFAQGFESAEAYAAIYDHVTSKPDAQPRLGVTEAPVAAAAAGGARTPSATPPASRPLSRPPSGPSQAATPTPATGRPAGNKTVIQVPSKKPASMDPRADSPSQAGAGGPSMRAGKGVDVLDETRPDSQQEVAAERKPPHTPPVASVVSSGPPPSESPTPPPEDIAAQSGPHHRKPESAVETRPAEIKQPEPALAKPPEPTTGGGSKLIFIVIAVLVLAGLIVVMLLNRP